MDDPQSASLPFKENHGNHGNPIFVPKVKIRRLREDQKINIL
jgi:RNA binding exosome subunit